jgi:pyruvate/2-oxoglutarate dehydrogenase complex dihydrolipoamide dehydrogenase (E3) component
MDGFYTTTLNEVMTISIVFSDGTKISEIETIESDGYFDGACTINMSSPPQRSLTLFVKQVIVNTGTKEVVYTISEPKSKEYRKNIENIVNAK